MLYEAYTLPEKPLDKESAIKAAEFLIDAMEPIHWANILEELEAWGFSLRVAAITINVSTGTISGWKTGSIPNYEAGRKLLALHATVRNSGCLRKE